MTTEFYVPLTSYGQRLGRTEVPRVGTYLRRYTEEYGEPFTYKGIKILEASVRELTSKLGYSYSSILVAEAERCIFDQWNRATDNPVILVRDPNGVWHSGVGWTPGCRVVSRVGTGMNRLLSAADEELVNEFYRDFEDNWRKSRKKYLAEQKKKGVKQKHDKTKKKQDEVNRTNARVRCAKEAAALKDELEVFLDNLDEDEITKEQVSNVYFRMQALSQANKNLKKVYGSKLPGE